LSDCSPSSPSATALPLKAKAFHPLAAAYSLKAAITTGSGLIKGKRSEPTREEGESGLKRNQKRGKTEGKNKGKLRGRTGGKWD
jgi:hypothetical protein